MSDDSLTRKDVLIMRRLLRNYIANNQGVDPSFDTKWFTVAVTALSQIFHTHEFKEDADNGNKGDTHDN